MATHTKDAVFYICNRAPGACGKTYPEHCYDCRHTTNPLFAKNGECRDPQNHPERFEAEHFDLGNGKIAIYYWERVPEEDANAV